MKAHIPPPWKPAHHFVLVVEDFYMAVFDNITLRKEGEHEKVIKAELAIPTRRGIYGFTNKEAADHFRRLANSGSEIQNAWDVSEQL